MSRRPLRGLLASLVLHAVLVAAVFAALPRSEVLPALYVDLTAVGPSEERTGLDVVPPAAVRAQARALDPAPPRQSGRRGAMPPPQRARLPESSTPSPVAGADAAGAGAPAAPAARSEPTPPIPIPPPPPSASTPALSPPPVAGPGDATASAAAPPAPAVSAAAPAEPEPPSASGALNGGVAVQLEPAPAQVRGRSAPGDVSGQHAAASPGGVPVAPDQGGARSSPGAGASRGAGARPELARRSPGNDGGEAPAVYTEYLARLRQRVHAALRYPPVARRRELTGAVTIELTILPSGMIRDVSVVKSSAHRLLDEAAVETVRELGAHPFPTSVPPRTLRVRLPIVFELQ